MHYHLVTASITQKSIASVALLYAKHNQLHWNKEFSLFKIEVGGGRIPSSNTSE